MHACVLDIGKSNAKICVLDTVTGAVLAEHRRPNKPVADEVGGALRQLDVGGLEHWLLSTLRTLDAPERIEAIVPVTHGAACVLLDGAGRVLLAPDYEDPRLAETSAAYDPLRDPFEATLSPSLPLGLNLGRQLHFVSQSLPDLFGRVRHILTYPQYWAWLLSGMMASELTSLGCHSDLWRPGEGRFSDLADRLGWSALFPPLRRAADRLGTIRPEIAARTGLPVTCQVLCGIHDSNASYLRHRAARPEAERFAVISSGTWTVLLAHGTEMGRLQQERDMLGNVDAFGSIVGTARFMGGREYAELAGPEPATGDVEALRRVLGRGTMALPSFAPAGPFQGETGRIIGPSCVDAGERAALASLYVACVIMTLLDLLGADGAIILEGPLAENPLVPGLLAGLSDGRPVLRGEERSGCLGGALRLLDAAHHPSPPRPTEPVLAAEIKTYLDRWQAHLQKTADDLGTGVGR